MFFFDIKELQHQSRPGTKRILCALKRATWKLLSRSTFAQVEFQFLAAKKASSSRPSPRRENEDTAERPSKDGFPDELQVELECRNDPGTNLDLSCRSREHCIVCQAFQCPISATVKMAMFMSFTSSSWASNAPPPCFIYKKDVLHIKELAWIWATHTELKDTVLLSYSLLWWMLSLDRLQRRTLHHQGGWCTFASMQRYSRVKGLHTGGLHRMPFRSPTRSGKVLCTDPFYISFRSIGIPTRGCNF